VSMAAFSGRCNSARHRAHRVRPVTETSVRRWAKSQAGQTITDGMKEAAQTLHCLPVPFASRCSLIPLILPATAQPCCQRQPTNRRRAPQVPTRGGLLFLLETARLVPSGAALGHWGRKFVNATATVQVDNERVIVTEWRFAPGADTGHHVHAHDYVVVPLTSGTLRLVDSDGVRDAALTAGVSYARLAGVAHNVINVNAHEFRFVEIELK